MVRALQTLQPYLMGTRLTVNTVHSALLWLMLITKPSGRLIIWGFWLAVPDHEVAYTKGNLND